MAPIAVLVVDRERAVAQAVARRLAAEGGLRVTGSAHTALGAIAAVERDRPDVVVFDEGVVVGDLGEIVTRLLDEGPDPGARARRMVVTSDRAEAQRAFESIHAGASAFVSKSDGADEIVRTILAVAHGESRIPPLILTGMLDEYRSRVREVSGSDPPFPQLTLREREVLECLTGGLDRDRIARRLGVSVHTVRTHTQAIFTKLDVHSSVEAVSVAARAGVVGPVRQS
jgi:DNA-binding NarL/FixJ family response regulator